MIKGKEVKNPRPLHIFTVWVSNPGYGEGRLRNNPDLARWLDEGDFTATSLLEIEAKGEQDTYDLNIEGSHNFVADGVVVHNSGTAPTPTRWPAAAKRPRHRAEGRLADRSR